MAVVVDTSVLIDVLRGRPDARDVLVAARQRGKLHASEITRLEVLAGMRPREQEATLNLLQILTWHPVTAVIAEMAGELGRRWLPAFTGIDAADLAIAATVQAVAGELLTCNVKHFPMFPDLVAPY